MVRLSGGVTFATAAEAARQATAACTVIAVEDRAAAEFAAALVPLTLAPVARVEGFAIGAGRAVGVDVFRTGGAP